MSQKLQNFVKFQKCQLDNLVDFEKCCKMRIYLQRSAPIQPKTSEILPKICQELTTTVPFPTVPVVAVGPADGLGEAGAERRDGGAELVVRGRACKGEAKLARNP